MKTRSKGDKLINRLALKNNRKNRSRSLLIMLSIFLSTALLTMITSYGTGLIRYDRAAADIQYGTYYGMFSSVTENQLEAVKENAAFTDIGIMRRCGSLDCAKPASLIYLDSTAVSLSSYTRLLAEGRMPEKGNEILASEGMFSAAGLEDISPGDRVSLSFRPDEKSTFREAEFTVSGIIKNTSAEDAGIAADGYTCVVTEDFFRKYCSPDESSATVLFRLSEDIDIDSQTASDVISGYANECGIRNSQVHVNTMYIMLALNPGTEIILTCALLIACIILFSMIVIYNIFQVSLVQRMQEYGRIKAVGATAGQLRKLITREGMFLAVPSIPAGSIAGYISAYFTFGWIVRRANLIQDIQVDSFTFFSPAAVSGSILLAALTVWLAMAKPKRTIANISAVEAIDYREGISLNRSCRKKHRKNSTGLRKGYENVNEKSLALANIASDKKHSVMTMATMGLTCVLFVVMSNCAGNIDTEYEARKSVAHGQFELRLDYTFYDEAYPENNLDNILKDNPMNSNLINRIKKIEGVTDVRYRDVLVSRMGRQLDSVEVLDREDFGRMYDEGASIGEFTYDSATENSQILFGWSSFLEDMGFSPGDTVEGNLENGNTSVDFSMEIGGSFGHSNRGWVITEDTFKNMGFTPGSCIGTIWVDCNEEDISEVEKELNTILADENHIDIESFSDSLKEQEFGGLIIKYAIYALLAVISIISFANLANTMIISITTRRREYGIMQAVGMTGKQLCRSLSFQGLIYTGGTLAVSLAAGIPLGFLAFRWCKQHALFGINVYHFPLAELLFMTAALMAMQLSLSWLLSRNLKRESLVERIRY